MTKYSKKAQEYVKKEMHEYKHHKRWESPQQAVAVGLSEAKEHGAKVPKKKKT